MSYVRFAPCCFRGEGSLSDTSLSAYASPVHGVDLPFALDDRYERDIVKLELAGLFNDAI